MVYSKKKERKIINYKSKIIFDSGLSNLRGEIYLKSHTKNHIKRSMLWSAALAASLLAALFIDTAGTSL